MENRNYEETKEIELEYKVMCIMNQNLSEKQLYFEYLHKYIIRIS